MSFLAALPPDDCARLLEERALRLEVAIVRAEATTEMLEKHRLPRLFWVETEFALAMEKAELVYVRKLARSIRDRTIDGYEWWHAVHHGGGEIPAAPEWEWPISEGEEN